MCINICTLNVYYTCSLAFICQENPSLVKSWGHVSPGNFRCNLQCNNDNEWKTLLAAAGCVTLLQFFFPLAMSPLQITILKSPASLWHCRLQKCDVALNNYFWQMTMQCLPCCKEIASSNTAFRFYHDTIPLILTTNDIMLEEDF